MGSHIIMTIETTASSAAAAKRDQLSLINRLPYLTFLITSLS
jgi:hypothetical protein